MTYQDIVGQDEAKSRLLDEYRSGRIPHALMLSAPSGAGALPLAVAYARHLLCSHPTEDGPCGQCQSCRMAAKLQHPDLHFAFPIFKRNGSSKPTFCAEFLPEWRELFLSNPYFDTADWKEAAKVGNQQMMIYESESGEIIRKLSLKSSQGDYKVLIMWLPEKMNESCANSLLKMIEEPYPQTVFILVSEEPENVLGTILSRTQVMELPPLPIPEVEHYLVSRYGVLEAEARRIARACEGNVSLALKTLRGEDSASVYLEHFKQLMRMAYSRNVRELRNWSDTLAAWGREEQKDFFAYCQRMIRENFIHNFGLPQLNYMSEQENEFATKFAPFINERNVIGIMDALSLAEVHVSQNVRAKIVLFDLALKMIVLIKNR